MAGLDDNFATDLTQAEGGVGAGPPSEAAPPRQPRDLRSLYERARADAAEARLEKLL